MSFIIVPTHVIPFPFLKSDNIAILTLIEPATPYEFSVLGFTPKREGVMTDVVQVVTDTAKPSPPIITNVNCTGNKLSECGMNIQFQSLNLGNGDILVEWRRSRVIYGRIDFFIVYYKSRLDHTYFKRKIEIGTKNSSDLYLVSYKVHYISNLQRHFPRHS